MSREAVLSGDDLSPEDRKALAEAVRRLETTGFARQLTDMAGQPIERALTKIPRPFKERLDRIAEAAILRSLAMAVRSLNPPRGKPPKKNVATLFAGLSGGIGGLLGVASLSVELPLTTTLMLRAIADIARHEGEDLSSLEARLACVEVFALGANAGKTRTDVGYYASRALLARVSGNAANYFLERSAGGVAGPVVAGFVSEVASRFGVVVSERIASSAVPVVGALGGAAVNALFMNYFQQLAHGHFVVRRLERRYGEETVRRHYVQAAEALAIERRAATARRAKTPPKT